MSDDHTLPPGFEDLQGLVGPWSLPDEPQRYAKRLGTPLPELRRFYDAIYARMDAVLRHLSTLPVAHGELAAPADRNLFRLALAYFEASHPIELRWSASDLNDAFPAHRIGYVGPSAQPD